MYDSAAPCQRVIRALNNAHIGCDEGDNEPSRVAVVSNNHSLRWGSLGLGADELLQGRRTCQRKEILDLQIQHKCEDAARLPGAWFKISDSLPVGTISAETAARKIIRALTYGDAEAHLGVSAKIGALAQGVAPGLTTDILGLVDRYVMPRPVTHTTAPEKGSENESTITESPLTRLTRKAEIANNQL